MAKRRPQRPDATGRTPTSRFARLDHRILTSAAYRSLAPNTRSLLVELAMLENGSNNGSIYLSVTDAAARMGVADHHTASAAFKDLEEGGFIERTSEAHFAIKASEASRARTWRLTWLPGPGRKAPSWDFNKREPGTPEYRRMERGLRALKKYKKASDQNKYPVVDSTTIDAFRDRAVDKAVVESTTLSGKNGANPLGGCMVDFHHHSAVTIGDMVEKAFIDSYYRDRVHFPADRPLQTLLIHDCIVGCLG